ncbi:MAG: hypothetical protein CMP89_03565 [Gammaproteobacteria bacterium]|nr:hypothetical protein [Gammaproteobacteria bacterium]
MNTLWIIGAFTEKITAKAAAEQHNGIIISSTSSQTSHLPFAALVLSATDDIETFRVAADIGCYLAAERNVKERPICELTEGTKPGVLGVFTMVANPKLDRLASDAHWRDNHAPLALQIHEAMTHYYQLSIQHRFHGPNWQGFALCCFASEDDLRNRFFNSHQGELAIAEDVAKFADTRQSPRRVIAKLA